MYFEKPGKLTEKTIPEFKSLVEKYPWFQAAWFLYLKNLYDCNSPDYEGELAKAAISVTDRKKLYNFLHVSDENISTINAASPEYVLEGKVDPDSMDNTSLIDKFLTSKPFFKKIRNEEEIQQEEKPDDEIIKNSLSENDEIITETLALIYFKQKKYEKAIEAFQKLSLKYPEKSIYFAARIKDIETLKNF